MTSPSTNADVYADLRAEVIALARGLTADEAALTVPQSPAWSIRDVVAHVVGIIDDILCDNLEGLGSDDWTAAQLAKRADSTLDEICDEWETLASPFRELGEANPVMAMRAGADLVTHHHDALQALGRTGERETAAVRMALERYGPYFCERAEQAGLPTVRVEAGDQIWQSGAGASAGGGEPAAVLTASAFEMLRAFSGRRSAAQILAMDWTGDAEPYLAVVSPYGMPTEDVVE